MKTHPLINTLKTMKGNPRVLVLLQPLWGIPNGLILPYATVYMLALGVSNQQIGILTSVNVALQFVFALLAGAFCDTFGRRKSSLMDIFAWSIPCLVWAISNSFTGFLIACSLNAVNRMSNTVWTCLMVEDTPEEQLVSIFSLSFIAGLLSGLFSFVAGILVARFTLIPVVRCIYFFAFLSMSAKIFLQFRLTKETTRGIERMQETRGSSIFTLLKGNGGVFAKMLRSRAIIFTLCMTTCYWIVVRISGDFWGTILKQHLMLSDGMVGIFSLLRAGMTLLVYLLFVPRISILRFKNPMFVGLLLFGLSQLMLCLAPIWPTGQMVLSVLCEGAALATLSPLIESITATQVDAAERPRMLGLMSAAMLAIMTPFGLFAGWLSAMHPTLPYIMNIALLCVAACFAFLIWKQTQSRKGSIHKLS